MADVCRRESGQVLPLTALVVAVAAAAALVLAQLGGYLVERAEAQTAADAAALAGAVEGRAGAADLAGRNGAELTGFERFGADAVVVVRVGRATATARASLDG